VANDIVARSADISGKDIAAKLNLIAQKMSEVLRVYPHPIPELRIRTPVERRTSLHVEFGSVVQMPVYLDPGDYRRLRFVAYTGSMFAEPDVTSVEIALGNNEVRYVRFYGAPSKSEIFADRYGLVALSHMFMPPIFDAVKEFTAISSRDDEAAQWLTDLIDAVEAVRRAEAVDSIDAADLLDRERRVGRVEVVLPRPTEDLEKFIAYIDPETDTLKIRMIFAPTPLLHGSDFWALITCELDGNRVKRAKLEVIAPENAPHDQLMRQIKHGLMKVPDQAFEDVAKFAKKLLRAYKVLRIALSYMNI